MSDYESSSEFIELSQFEKDIFKLLNNFRENPKILTNELEQLHDNLIRFRPNDPFINDISAFLRQLKDVHYMKPLELNDSLSKYAKTELERFIANPDNFTPAKRGAECTDIISSLYLAENPGIIYSTEAQDPFNVIEKIIFNEKDTHRIGKLIILNPSSTQLGIAHDEDIGTGQNYTVIILADNYIDDDTEKLPEGDISHMKMAFDLLDYDKEGRCRIANVLDIMTGLGYDETDPALFDIIKGMDNSPYVSWPKFANYVYDRLNDRYTYMGLNDIFQITKDNINKEFIDITKLRDICKFLKIEKTDAELIQMIRNNLNKDKIYFEDFCDILGIEFDLLKSTDSLDDPKTIRTMKIINKSLNKRGRNNKSYNKSLNRSLNRSLNKSYNSRNRSKVKGSSVLETEYSNNNKTLNKSINVLNRSLMDSWDDSFIFKKKKYRYDQ